MKVTLTHIEKNGKKVVQLPLNQWKSVEKKLKHLQEKDDLRKHLTQAFKEVNEIKTGKRKRESAESFLNGLKSTKKR